MEDVDYFEDITRTLHALRFTIGHNQSDNTFGWKDSLGSFIVYYTHFPLEYSYSHLEEHSHALVDGVTPHVTIQLRSTRYMNKPFTTCTMAKGYTQSLGLNNEVLISVFKTIMGLTIHHNCHVPQKVIANLKQLLTILLKYAIAFQGTSHASVNYRLTII